MDKNLEIIIQSAGLTIMPDNAQWTNRFEIRSETSNRLYTIAKNKNTGDWGCSCPGWITRRKCKHLNSISSLTRLLDQENGRLQKQI